MGVTAVFTDNTGMIIMINIIVISVFIIVKVIARLMKKTSNANRTKRVFSNLSNKMTYDVVLFIILITDIFMALLSALTLRMGYNKSAVLVW
jgi:uncharacterized membrane protein